MSDIVNKCIEAFMTTLEVCLVILSGLAGIGISIMGAVFIIAVAIAIWHYIVRLGRYLIDKTGERK